MVEKIKDFLIANNISFKIYNHLPVYTVEEAKEQLQEVQGPHLKNLFMKDRKSKKFFLYILPAEKRANLQELSEKINEKLKFANENNLKDLLGLTPGSVSPFGLINDKDKIVNVLIDKEIWNIPYFRFHPNINTETLEIAKQDFIKFLELTKNKYQII